MVNNRYEDKVVGAYQAVKCVGKHSPNHAPVVLCILFGERRALQAKHMLDNCTNTLFNLPTVRRDTVYNLEKL